MSRYKTRLRRACFVEAKLADGRRLTGKCVHVDGKTAHVGNLRWRGSKAEVKAGDASEVAEIEFEEVGKTTEREAVMELISGVLTGTATLRGWLLTEGIFGGGPLAAAAADPTSDATLSASSPPSLFAAFAADPAACSRHEVLSDLDGLQAAGRVNASQREAIEAVLLGPSSVNLVQGPPGTGKTTVISHAVALWLRRMAPRLPPVGRCRHAPALACVARSNVAARNIALALLRRGLGPSEFRLVVSREFHHEWHEEQYRGRLEEVLIVSDELQAKDAPRRLQEVPVFVTTVAMLASSRFRETALHGKALSQLLVDEASQIYAGDLLLPLHVFGAQLRSLSLFGDDKQLPPYGSAWDGAQLHSMFDHLAPPPPVYTLRHQPGTFRVGPPLCPPAGGGAQRLMLSVSYRLPPELCAFISAAMYGGLLAAGRPPRLGRPAVRWINFVGREDKGGGTSIRNKPEAEVVCRLLKQEILHSGDSWTVLTGYDLQRSLLDKEMVRRGLAAARRGGGGARGRGRGRGGTSTGGGPAVSDASDCVYNIDTFQGREDEVVVVSLVRCKASLGFMVDDRRVNVMLTRCTKQLIVVGSLDLALAHPHTLIGHLAAWCLAEGRVEAAETLA